MLLFRSGILHSIPAQLRNNQWTKQERPQNSPNVQFDTTLRTQSYAEL